RSWAHSRVIGREFTRRLLERIADIRGRTEDFLGEPSTTRPWRPPATSEMRGIDRRIPIQETKATLYFLLSDFHNAHAERERVLALGRSRALEIAQVIKIRPISGRPTRRSDASAMSSASRTRRAPTARQPETAAWADAPLSEKGLLPKADEHPRLPAQDSSHRRARWCRSGRASSNRTSIAGLASWRMVNLAPSPAMYTGECWGAWARASFIAPAIVSSVPSDVQVGQLISNAIL